MSLACRFLTLFTAIAEKAGRDLTYQSFERAGFSLGDFQVPGYIDKSNYSQNTPDGDLPLHRYNYDSTRRRFVLTRD